MLVVRLAFCFSDPLEAEGTEVGLVWTVAGLGLLGAEV